MPTKGRITSFRLGAWSATFSGRCDTICDQAKPRKTHRTSEKIRSRTDVIMIGFVIIGLMTWKRNNKHITKIPPRGPSRTGREAGNFQTLQGKKKKPPTARSTWAVCGALGRIRTCDLLIHRLSLTYINMNRYAWLGCVWSGKECCLERGVSRSSWHAGGYVPKNPYMNYSRCIH